MKSSIRQMYVSIELSDETIKILVTEFFNTRFNIVKVIKMPLEGISNFEIIDKQKALTSIKNALSETNDKLGAKIEEAILVLPSYNISRIPLKVNINPTNGILEKGDIIRAINNSSKIEIDKNHIVVDNAIIKYTVNGISSRRFPEKELCDDALIDIDLLCADKNMTYAYVSLLEESGLKVLDISLNSYAIAKEAALFEQALNQNIILINIDYKHTFLTLLSKGKIIMNEIINEGFGTFVNTLISKYKLSSDIVSRLLKYNVSFEGDYLDDVVYGWKNDDKSYSLTTRNISEDIKDVLNGYTKRIIDMCKPIINNGSTKIIVTGEGADMSALIDILKKDSQVEVITYYPDTIGIRESGLTALFGACVAYRDKVILEDLNVNCIDLLEYDRVVDRRKIDVEGETITSRIKNLFKQYRKEDIK